jgi:hypothetical protein
MGDGMQSGARTASQDDSAHVMIVGVFSHLKVNTA